MRRNPVALFGIIVLAVLAILLNLPNSKGIHVLGINSDFKISQGLDLQGGIQFLMQATCPTDTPNCGIAQNLPTTIQNIQTRVNGSLGVSEAVVTSQQDPSSGKYYISVELPGVKDTAQALSLIGTTGQLQFIDTQGTSLPLNTVVPAGQYKVAFTGRDLDVNAIGVSYNAQNQPQIDFAFKGDAKTNFATYTQANIGKYLTVTLDGKVIESAIINSQITGPGQISGGFTNDEAVNVSRILKYGSLPLSLNVASERTIDATLGAQAVNYSLRAALIGLTLVVLFMLLYYRLPGLVATLALALYAGLLLTLIKLLGIVLTLAGIAGVILSVGMAVDANILIFERIKEELRGGRTLSGAIEIGWKRAWPSIRDSNASTIITCLILSWVGNNFGATVIVGFATNLLLGVAVSLFTAVVVTRTLLSYVLSLPGLTTRAWLFSLPQEAMTIPTYRRGGNNRSPVATPVAPTVALAGHAGAHDISDADVEE